MSSIAVIPTVVQDIVDNADERELWIVGREFERPPYFHAGKGGDTRLARALRVCVEGRITPNSDGSYTVEGSEHRTYRVAESCSCPQSQQSKSKYCYHYVSVCLYVEWQRRLRPVAPVALGTLRAGTLPLPPVTVEERLAQSTTIDLSAAYVEAVPSLPEQLAAAVATQVALGTMHDTTALQTHHTPQEDRMPQDEYIPEPDTDHVSTAVLEPPDTTAATPRPLPGPVLLPSLDARTLEQSMQAWAEQRQVVKRFIQTQLVDGTDYYTLQMGQRASKPTLSKAGSEKFLGLFQLHAVFEQDTATWTMLGEPKGTLCYVCHLLTRSGEVVSEGRGARDVLKEKDINKAIKMAQKSAQIDAVLRTGALSEAFTQDIGEPEEEPVKTTTQAKPTSADLRKRIWAQVNRHAPHIKTQDDAKAWVHERTGLTMEPDQYQAILTKLQGVGV